MRWMLGFIIVSAGIYFGWQWLDGHMSQQAWAVFNPESSSYELIADGWPVLWKTWPVFIPAALLFGAVVGLFGYIWGKFATENDYASENADIKKHIERLKDRVKTERQNFADAYQNAISAVKTELADDFESLERERQDLTRQQRWVDEQHQKNDAREAKLADAESVIESEIASFKRKIELRALEAESQADVSRQQVEAAEKNKLHFQRLVDKLNRQQESLRAQNLRLKTKLDDLRLSHAEELREIQKADQ